MEPTQTEKLIAAAVAAERERCYRIALAVERDYGIELGDKAEVIADEIMYPEDYEADGLSLNQTIITGYVSI